MNPTFNDIVDLLNALIWPLVLVFLVLMFRRETKSVIRAVVERVTKVSAFGIEIQLAANQVASDRLGRRASPEEKAKSLRDLEIARAAAMKFDYWMKNYNHPASLSHRDAMLNWLVADRGALYVARDYGVFKALAEVVSKMGYNTDPPPSEKEFEAWLEEADKQDAKHRTR